MCGINPQQRAIEAQLLGMGLNFITKLVDRELTNSQVNQSTDVLGTATVAYQQGKITKAQYLAVIEALDEPMPSRDRHSDLRQQVKELKAEALLVKAIRGY